MARRGLLNEADRKQLFGLPDDDASLTSFYSLGCEDRDFVLSKRGAIRGGKAFPLTGAKVAGTPPSAGRPRNAPCFDQAESAPPSNIPG